MRIASFDDLFPDRIASGGIIYSSTGSNGGLGDLAGGGDVVGTPGNYSVVGLRSTVALASNLGSGVLLGDVLTIIQASPALARFATPSNAGGGGDTTGVLGAGWDGGLSLIVAPHTQDVVVPFTGTLTGWKVYAKQTGTATFGIGKSNYASFPTFTDIIGAGTAPSLTTANHNQSASMASWTTAVTAGDVLRFSLLSTSDLYQVVVALTYSRP